MSKHGGLADEASESQRSTAKSIPCTWCEREDQWSCPECKGTGFVEVNEEEDAEDDEYHTSGIDLPKNSSDDPQRLSEASGASLRQQIVDVLRAMAGYWTATIRSDEQYEIALAANRLYDLIAAQQTALLEELLATPRDRQVVNTAGMAGISFNVIEEALSKLRKEQ